MADEIKDVKKYYAWKSSLRQRARTDLLYLCREVLQYRDIEPSVHGEMIEQLQKFKGGEDRFASDTKIAYKPFEDLWTLKGPRERLILFPRGHLKTTIITMSHAIQWIINYPDIRILFSTATGDQVVKLVRETKAHFQWNEHFRWLFPEFCPPASKAADFGSNDQFEVPCRERKWLKEPTLSTCSVGKVIAGGHYEVIFNSDLVDKENVKTPNQIEEVKSHFGYMNPLLERGPMPPYRGWTYVEGTPYDYSDLYQTIQDGEEKKKEKSWLIFIRGARKDDGTALWPTRFPNEELERIRQDPTVGDVMFHAQYLCRPIPSGQGLCDPKQIRWFSRDILRELISRLRLHVTIDLAGMESDKTRTDFTVITLAGFDRDGRPYVLEIRRGHFTPFEVINHIFDLHSKYPQICDFKIEKDAHARVLLPFMQREMSKRQRFPMMVALRRDNRTSKEHRIRALQPWFETGTIRFVDDLSCKIELINEIARFPKYAHDDILDTLADQMQNRDSDGVTYDVFPDPPKFEVGSGDIPRLRNRFLGFERGTGREEWLFGDAPETEENPNYAKGTGL